MIQAVEMNAARYLIACLLLSVSTAVHAQEAEAPVWLSPESADQNLLKKVAAQYPQMAKIAHVEGDVLINVVISAEGKVTSLRALSGHPILIQAAMNAVRQWEFRPYVKNGQPHAATTLVEVGFFLNGTPKQIESPARTYYKREIECRSLLDQQAFEKAEMACALLPALAKKVGGSRAEVEAYALLGDAKFKISKFQDALAAWRRELAIVQEEITKEEDRGISDDAGLGAANYDVARGLQATGDLEAAKTYYQKAEPMLERVYNDYPANNQASRELKLMLRDYASFLRQAGDSQQAEAAERKAESIKIQGAVQGQK